MAATKIINVLKDDSFEELLDIFRDASAQEIIFVLPKKSKAFQAEGHFVILQKEAQIGKKAVSFLCSNPDVNALAKQYKFDILMPKQTGTRKAPKVKMVNTVQPKKIKKEPEPLEELASDKEYFDFLERETGHSSDLDIQKDEPEEKQEPVMEPEDPEEEEIDQEPEYEAVTTLAKSKRGMDDMVRADHSRSVPVHSKEKHIKLDIHSQGSKKEAEILKEMQGLWKSSQNQVKDTFRKPSWPFNLRARQGKPLGTTRWVAGALAIVIILFGTAVYVTAGTAKIEIRPLKHPLDLQFKVSASDRFSSVDSNTNRVPGQLFNIQKSVSGEYSTTGERDVAQKAKGKILVYNKLSSPQPLIATTRFRSSQGYIFRSLTTITVPAAKNSIPGTVEVNVIADKADASYNIEPGQFNIPAFQEKGDTQRYQNVYGESKEAMRGGTNGKAKIVSESDYIKGKDELTNKLKVDLQTGLKSEIAGLTVISDAIPNIMAPESTAQIDDAAESFEMTLNGSLKTIGFQEKDILTLVSYRVEKANNLTVIADKVEVEYSNPKLNSDTNTIEFNVQVKGNAYGKIDEKKIISDLAGRKEDQIREYLKGLAQVKSARVLLSPFWVSKVPKEETKVKIQLIYE